MVVSFYDPDGDGLKMLTQTATTVAMFGWFVTVKAFENRPPFSQCSRCVRLGHTVERYMRPNSLIVCSLCGGAHWHRVLSPF